MQQIVGSNHATIKTVERGIEVLTKIDKHLAG